MSRRAAVGCRAVWMCMCCTVPTKSASQPRHVHLPVQRESTVVSAAGQEVQPQRLQVGEQDGHAKAKAFGGKTTLICLTIDD